MQIALLGLPAAGKRTLLELMTGRATPASRKAGEVVEGVAPIRDARVDEIARIVKPKKITYAENLFALCPDMGGENSRAWLDPARKADLLCVVVRGFTDPAIYHPSGSVNAQRDAELLAMELAMADLDMIDKRLERLEKERRVGLSPGQQAEERVLKRCRTAIEASSGLRSAPVEVDTSEMAAVRSLGLLALKPLLWVWNVDEGTPMESGPDKLVICLKIEKEIAQIASADERREYLQMMGLSESGVDRVNAAAYDRLGLMSFYTMGEDEARAWTIVKGARAPEAAGKIHTDIERGFIRAEVVKYDDLLACGSEAAVKAAGKALLKGKDYVIEDGDICHFRFSV